MTAINESKESNVGTKFFRIKLAVLDVMIAVNADDVRAVMPSDKTDGYFVWLASPLNVSSDIVTRIAKLGGVAPIDKDFWEVTSTDLKELFPNSP